MNPPEKMTQRTRVINITSVSGVARLQRAVGSRVLEAHTALLLGLSSLGLRPVPDRWSEAPAAPAALTAPAVPTPSAPRLLQLAREACRAAAEALTAKLAWDRVRARVRAGSGAGWGCRARLAPARGRLQAAPAARRELCLIGRPV